MLAKKCICVATLFLAAAGLHAQGLGPQQNTSQGDTVRPGLTRNDLTALRYEESSRMWDSRTTELLNNGMASMPKIRAQLAVEWQRLGIPAEQAKVIASAYRGDDRRLARAGSLAGKSGPEVAAMMQSALASKNYRQANQLLIDYERAQLKLEQIGTSTPGAR